jgi:hypothetical protein
MKRTLWAASGWILARLSATAIAVAGVAAPVVAHAQPPDDCIGQFIWRMASPSDHVCVGGGMAHEVHVQNLHPNANKVSDTDTCVSGFVWREAFDGDTVCVTPDFRAQVRADNAAGPSRKVKTAPPPQQTGQHTVHLAIDTFNTSRLVHFQIEPPGVDEQWNSTAPWSRDMTIGPNTTSLGLKGWSSGPKVRCTLDVDGVRISEMEGSFVWCKWPKS